MSLLSAFAGSTVAVIVSVAPSSISTLVLSSVIFVTKLFIVTFSLIFSVLFPALSTVNTCK